MPISHHGDCGNLEGRQSQECPFCLPHLRPCSAWDSGLRHPTARALASSPLRASSAACFRPLNRMKCAAGRLRKGRWGCQAGRKINLGLSKAAGC